MTLRQNIDAARGMNYRNTIFTIQVTACQPNGVGVLARAGSTSARPFSDDKKLLPRYAWYDEKTRKTCGHPVAQSLPNQWAWMTCSGTYGSGRLIGEPIRRIRPLPKITKIETFGCPMKWLARGVAVIHLRVVHGPFSPPWRKLFSGSDR